MPDDDDTKRKKDDPLGLYDYLEPEKKKPGLFDDLIEKLKQDAEAGEQATDQELNFDGIVEPVDGGELPGLSSLAEDLPEEADDPLAGLVKRVDGSDEKSGYLPDGRIDFSDVVDDDQQAETKTYPPHLLKIASQYHPPESVLIFEHPDNPKFAIAADLGEGLPVVFVSISKSDLWNVIRQAARQIIEDGASSLGETTTEDEWRETETDAAFLQFQSEAYWFFFEHLPSWVTATYNDVMALGLWSAIRRETERLGAATPSQLREIDKTFHKVFQQRGRWLTKEAARLYGMKQKRGPERITRRGLDKEMWDTGLRWMEDNEWRVPTLPKIAGAMGITTDALRKRMERAVLGFREMKKSFQAVRDDRLAKRATRKRR